MRREACDRQLVKFGAEDSAVSPIKIDWMQIGNSSVNLRSRVSQFSRFSRLANGRKTRNSSINSYKNS